MDDCNHSSSAEFLAVLRETAAALDKFLCDLDTFICEEEEVLARYGRNTAITASKMLIK